MPPLHDHATPPGTTLAQLTGATLAMLLVSMASEQSIPGHGAASLFLPASGVALTLVLCSGLALLPGIALGMALSGALAGLSLTHTLALTLGTVVATGLAGRWLLRHSPFDVEQPHFAALRHLLLAGCAVGAGAGSIAGGTLIWLIEGGNRHAWVGEHIVQAWMGQALGMLLVTPLLLNYRRALVQPLSLKRWREGIPLALLAAAAGSVIFGQVHTPWLAPVANAYWMFLFVGWSGMRLGLLPTMALLCLIALQALWGTSAGGGFFAGDVAATWGFGYWSYMMILGVHGLALASYMADRRQNKLQLRIAATAFNIHMALLVTDARGRILQANPAFQALTGHDAQDLLGHTPEELQAQDRRNPPATWFTSAANAEHRLRLLHRDGSPLSVWGSVSPVRDGRGRIGHRVIALADLTDFEAAQARQRQVEQAQRDALVREVHHRIKNNLQGIVGMLRMLAQQHPPLQEAVAQMATQVQSIAVVYGLQGRAVTEEIDLCELVQAVAQGAGHALNATLGMATARGAASTRLSPAEAVPVALVLNELMTNAIKHGGGALGVRVALSCGPTEAVVTLSNPGHWSDAAAGKAPLAGHGLDLVRLLLPRQGAWLTHEARSGQVVTTLTLRPPVVHITDA